MQYIQIGDKEYPFHFGQRELQTISRNFADLSANGQQIEYEKIGQRMADSFDLFLHAFHTACQKGCRRHKRDEGTEIEPLSELELEDAIDDNPGLYEELFEAFNSSRIVKHYEEEPEGKKTKS